MEMRLRLPVGIDSFEKLRKGNYYYVDKTALIEQALEKGSEVTLFTRPRRFSGCETYGIVVYPSETFRKIPEYEYAQKLF